MPIYELDGKRPEIGPDCYIHPTAVIIGDVVIGGKCWIGPNTTIRSDFHKIRIGPRSDVQDNCVVHGETVLGARTHMGHGAIVHGATLGEDVLVAMNAVVLDRAELGDRVIVAAGAVVSPGARVPAGKMVMGVPGAIVGDVPPGKYVESDEEGYVGAIPSYLEGLREISLEDATTSPQPGGEAI